MKRTIQRLHTLYPTRNVGHTRLMIEGAANFKGPFLLVSANRGHADLIVKQIKEVNPETQVIARGLDDPPLRGQRLPQVIDNFGLLALLDEALTEFRELHTEIRELRATLESLKPVL